MTFIRVFVPDLDRADKVSQYVLHGTETSKKVSANMCKPSSYMQECVLFIYVIIRERTRNKTI